MQIQNINKIVQSFPAKRKTSNLNTLLTSIVMHTAIENIIIRHLSTLQACPGMPGHAHQYY